MYENTFLNENIQLYHGFVFLFYLDVLVVVFGVWKTF